MFVQHLEQREAPILIGVFFSYYQSAEFKHSNNDGLGGEWNLSLFLVLIPSGYFPQYLLCTENAEIEIYISHGECLKIPLLEFPALLIMGNSVWLLIFQSLCGRRMSLTHLW